MKDSKTLDTLIAAEQAKIEKLEEKQSDIMKKIKASKSVIAKYTMMKNNQKFNSLSNALDNKGISIEDILSAIAAGDMLSLQEKIESGEENNTAQEDGAGSEKENATQEGGAGSEE